MVRRRLLSGLIFSAFFLGVLIALLYRAPKAQAFDNARWGANFFPNTELTTQDGKKVKFYDDLVRGKIVVIDLIYTHCVDACPLETARLAQVQKMLGDAVGKEIFFYSITLDPKRDTPAVLKAYAEKYHAGPGWLFLTGNKADIDQLSRKIGLYTEPDPDDRDGHTPSVLIGSEPTGQWMRNGATDNPRFLAMLIGDWLNNWKYSEGKQKKSYSEATAVKLDPGAYIYNGHCAACHTIGHGDKIGPDLLGVTSSRNRDWLKHFIQQPEKMIAEQDPTAIALFEKYKEVRMPNLRLVDGDVETLIKFLEQQTAKPNGKTLAEKQRSGIDRRTARTNQ